jgi:hypothetical protein
VLKMESGQFLEVTSVHRRLPLARLLIGRRLRGFFADIAADFVAVVVKVGPLALHRRLQHHAILGTSHAEQGKEPDDDNGQNPHTWPM